MAIKKDKQNLLDYALIWYLRTPLFWHYYELCVSRYPSPLDEDAPPSAKMTLLAIAGLTEYISSHAMATALAGFFCLLRKVVLMEPQRTNHDLFRVERKYTFIPIWLSDPI